MRGKMGELEGRWLMGRAAPWEMLEGIGRYLRLETPERKDEDPLGAIEAACRKGPFIREADRRAMAAKA